MTEETTAGNAEIEKLIDSFMEELRAGKLPSIEEYARKYPDSADQLRALLPVLMMLGESRPDGSVPQEMGEFIIIRQIGRGGMGVVYEAVQQSLGRHVALKVLPPSGTLDPSQLERFRLEARAAARLHHSHIVPVFGVGQHQGSHYYAMQFIQGQGLDQVIDTLRNFRLKPIHEPAAESPNTFVQRLTDGLLSGNFVADEAAAQQPSAPQNAQVDTSVGAVSAENPTLAATLSYSPPKTDRSPEATKTDNSTPRSAAESNHSELSASHGGREFFRSVARIGLQVAEALGYAHSEGILHRDIKPSNLLLDAKGNVWITDFGLAKTEGSEGLTETGEFVGTLRYMAPERFDGWSDRRSDIYSLGVTLYELMTLRPCFPAKTREQLIDQILHDRPVSPSKFDRSIPRDLETIVLKALAMESTVRYRSAEEMAQDLQRFLDDRPILARRTTYTERLVRWCRRNPGMATLSITLLLVLVTISAVAPWIALRQSELRMQADDALVQQKKATALANQRAQEAAERFKLAVGAFQQLVFGVQTRLDNRADVQDLRASLLTTAQKGLAQLVEGGDDASGAHKTVVWSHLVLGDVLLRTGKTSAALEQFQKGLAAANRAIEDDPQDANAQRDLADSYERMGHVHQSMGNTTQARECYQKFHDIVVKLAADDPKSLYLQGDLSLAYEKLGDISRTMGNGPQAREFFQKKFEIDSTIVANNPKLLGAQRTLGLTYERLGEVAHLQGDAEEARGNYQKQLDIFSKLVAAQPKDIRYRADLARSYRELGDIVQTLGDAKQARGLFRKGHELLEKLASDDPQNATTQIDLAVSFGRLGNVANTLGDLAQEREAYTKQNTILQKRAVSDPKNVPVQAELAFSFQSLGEAINNSEDTTKALEYHQKALELRQSLAAADPQNMQAQRNVAASFARLGDTHLTLGNAARARDYFQKRNDILFKLATDDPGNAQAQRDLAVSYGGLGRAYQELGEFAKALEYFQEQQALLLKLAAEDPKNTLDQRLLAHSNELLGDVSLKLEEPAKAKEFYQNRYDILVKLAKEDSENFAAQLRLANAENTMGKIYCMQGDAGEAKQHQEAALKMASQMAKARSENPAVQRLLAACYEGMADISMKGNDAAAARTNYDKSLEILAKLAQLNAANANTKRDLGELYPKLAETASKLGEIEKAKDYQQKAQELAKRPEPQAIERTEDE